MTFLRCLLVVVVVLAYAEEVITTSDELWIHSAREFIEFSRSVNNGTSYSGSTVYLESDIDFSGELSQELEPVGKDWDNNFLGTFDGQGHTFSNLKMNSSSNLVGLFGYSKELVVKNVIVDSSCSIEGSFTDSNAFVGGIAGRCDLIGERIIFENNVNMANVSFTVNGTHVYLGGIASCLHSESYDGTFYVRNCVNYGTIRDYGHANRSIIGGIVGECWGSSSTKYIQNSLNCGDVIYSGTVIGGEKLYIGGIGGWSWGAVFENCVNTGMVYSAVESSLGGIVGQMGSPLYTDIAHCFWVSSVNCTNLAGLNVSLVKISNSYQSEANPGLVGGLNGYFGDGNNTWRKWALNPNNSTITLVINNAEALSYSSQLILLPDYSGTNESSSTFSGWYKDPYFAVKFDGVEFMESITLYSLCGAIVTVTLNFNSEVGHGIQLVPKKLAAVNNSYGDLPTPTKLGHRFVGWFDDNNEIVTSESVVRKGSDHTLYAHWEICNYNVTFEPNEGYVSQTYKTITFNKSYGDLPTPTKLGHMFVGWFDDNNEIVTSESVVKKGSDHTLYGHWEICEYFVTFDLGNGTKIEKGFNFNESIAYPDNIEREGYAFDGWNPKVVLMPGNNLTISAGWIEAVEATEFVEVIIKRSDLTKSEAEEITRRFTTAVFSVERIELIAEAGETRIVVRFVDREEAEKFVRTAKSSGDRSIIKMRFANGSEFSFSSVSCPFPFLFFSII